MIVGANPIFAQRLENITTSIRMVIHTTIECLCCISSQEWLHDSLSSWMHINKLFNIVYNSINNNVIFCDLCTINEFQFFNFWSPIQSITFLVQLYLLFIQLFLFHLQVSFFIVFVINASQIVSQSKFV